MAVARRPGAGVTTDEVIANLLGAVADETLAGLIRAAYSPNIKERADCSASVFDAEGQTVATASPAPLHLGAIDGLVATLCERVRRDGAQPGDVWVGNDPYVGGGTHLNDIAVVAPLLVDGELYAYVANAGHHADVGGRAPGSESGDNTSIFQDGLRIPAVKLVDAGRLRDDVMDLILLNSRTPEERRGDLRAQLAALHIGSQRLHEVVARYGPSQLGRSMAAVLEATEARFRSAVRALPDGVYAAEDYLDDDGFGGDPVRIAVTITVSGDRIHLDFGGSAAELPSGKNMAPGGLGATVYYALKALLDPDLPNNSGYYRAVSIQCPEGSVLRPRPPAAVGSRAMTAQIVAEAIFAALGRAMPTRVMARSGIQQGVIFSGVDPRTGRFYVDYENFAPGTGARGSKDGADCMQVHITNTSNLPIEVFETEFPLTVERFELIPESGGAGRFRGGLGVRRDVRLESDGRLAVRSARQRVAAQGLDGGAPGAVGSFELVDTDGSVRRIPPTATDVPLRAGQCVIVRTPGGGGIGHPRDRAPERVVEDVREGRLSVEAARAVYGVVVPETGTGPGSER
jgi:N-methylhydantoinase B